MLSVIIPVYNVRAYLDECLCSVVNQSFRNMEIILIDDGSTDGSGDLCDKWVRKDKRIRVIHKNNGGLSSARNVGLEDSKGEYVTFVDSDDLIDNEMYDSMIRIFQQKKEVDIVCCAIEQFDNNNYQRKASFLKSCNQEFTAVGYLREVLKHKIDNAVWNKIYKRDIIDPVRFEEGKINEDILFNVAILNRVNKLFYIKQPFYKYRIRQGSITKQANPKMFDFINNAFKIKHFLQKEMKVPLLVEIEGYIFYEMVNYIASIEKYNAADHYQKEIKFCKDYILHHPITSFSNPYWSYKQKIKFFLVAYFATFYRVLLNQSRHYRL